MDFKPSDLLTRCEHCHTQFNYGICKKCEKSLCKHCLFHTCCEVWTRGDIYHDTDATDQDTDSEPGSIFLSDQAMPHPDHWNQQWIRMTRKLLGVAPATRRGGMRRCGHSGTHKLSSLQQALATYGLPKDIKALNAREEKSYPCTPFDVWKKNLPYSIICRRCSSKVVIFIYECSQCGDMICGACAGFRRFHPVCYTCEPEEARMSSESTEILKKLCDSA